MGKCGLDSPCSFLGTVDWIVCPGFFGEHSLQFFRICRLGIPSRIFWGTVPPGSVGWIFPPGFFEEQSLQDFWGSVGWIFLPGFFGEQCVQDL